MNQRPNQSPHLNITKCFLSISIYIFLCPFLCIPGFSSISLYFYLSLFITLHIYLCIKIPTEWNLVYSPGQFVRILELGIILALTGVYFPFNLTACHQIKLPSCWYICLFSHRSYKRITVSRSLMWSREPIVKQKENKTLKKCFSWWRNLQNNMF